MNSLLAPKPPTSPEDIDRIIDLYFYESVPANQTALVAGGEGAYCYYGSPAFAAIGGTALVSVVDQMLKEVAANSDLGEDFRLEVDGRSWRACRDESERGTQVTLRRLPDHVPRLSELDFKDPMVRELIKSPWLNDGGVALICGLTGQGKTTTAGAMVRDRLELFGGRCITVEDVIEMNLEGLWVRGSCRQLKVDYFANDERVRGFSGAIRRAYRSMPATRPALLYVGEIRDTETAVEVVKAASNGMLVIATVHSSDPVGALLRVGSLAEKDLGDGAYVALSQALRLVVHQSLNLDPNTAGWTRGSIDASILLSSGPAHPLANLLRKRDFSQMQQIHTYQNVRLKLSSQSPATPAAFIHGLSN